MLEGSCHCGAITISIPRAPRSLTDCNCSICRRYGVLWAYFSAQRVTIRAARGARASYVWGSRHIRFVHCRRCGCVTHWQEVKRTSAPRMGVNARNFPPADLVGVRIRHLDGAHTWKYLD
jgi:hypothetical protein